MAFEFWTDRKLEESPDAEWQVEDLLLADSLAMIYGPSGVGKTFWNVALAGAVATGADFLGREVEAGDVLYIAAESVWQLKPRFRALRKMLGVKTMERLRIVPAPVHFHDAAELQEFIVAAKQAHPDPFALTIVDTLSRCSAGSDGSDNAHTELTVDGLKRVQATTGGTVLVVHHTGWNEQRERGAYALRAAMDTILALRKVDGAVVLEVEKQRAAATGDRIGVALTPFEGSLIVESDTARRDPLSEHTSTALELLDKMALSSGLSTGEWMAAWTEKYRLSRSLFYQAKKILIVDGLVSVLSRGRNVISPKGLELVQSPAKSSEVQCGPTGVSPVSHTPLKGVDSGLRGTPHPDTALVGT